MTARTSIFLVRAQHRQRVGDVQRRVKHPAIPWMAATLDGIVEGTEAVFEAKFMLPCSFSEEAAAEKYMAQLPAHTCGSPLRHRGVIAIASTFAMLPNKRASFAAANNSTRIIFATCNRGRSAAR